MTSITLVKQGLVKIWRWNCYQRSRLSISYNCAQQGFVRKMGITVWFAAHEQHQLCECVSSDTKSCQSILSAGSMCEGYWFICRNNLILWTLWLLWKSESDSGEWSPTTRIKWAVHCLQLKHLRRSLDAISCECGNCLIPLKPAKLWGTKRRDSMFEEGFQKI